MSEKRIDISDLEGTYSIEEAEGVIKEMKRRINEAKGGADDNSNDNSNRDKLFEENEEFIKTYVLTHLKDYINEIDEDDEDEDGEIHCYHDGDDGWDCKGGHSKDNPIDKCVYSFNLSFGDDSCIFCGQPSERK